MSYLPTPKLHHLDYDNVRNCRPDYTTLPADIGHEFQAALEGMRQELPEALSYKVVHSKAVLLRAEPSVYSKELGRLQPGEVVKGFPVGSWLLVTYANGALPAEGAWVLADGAQLGVGALLTPEWAQMTLHSIKDGVHAQWPGMKHSDAFYYLQWEPKYGAEGTDGGAVIAKQPKDVQGDVVAIVSGPGVVEGKIVKLRPIARLSCGLLVGHWREHVIEDLVDVSSLKAAEVVPADALTAETERYSQLVEQLALYQKKKNFEYSELDRIMQRYNTRPKEHEEAKEVLLTALFGKGKDTRGNKAAAEGNVQDMFSGATGVYEEGISGDCNKILAEVISTLARKHG